MTIDTSNFTNLTSLQAVAQFTNNSVDGVLFTGGMIVFFIILLMFLIKFNQMPFENNFTVGSFVMTFVSTFFWYAKLLPTAVPLIFLAFTVVGTFMLYGSKD